MNPSFRQAVRERFGVKLLLAFTGGIFISMAVFTAVVALREGDRLKQALRERGETYTEFLAQGSVIGIFSENEQLLRQAAVGVLAARDVVSVSMYGGNGKLLFAADGDAAPAAGSAATAARAAVRQVVTAGTTETAGTIEIVLPVMSALPPAGDASLYFGSGDADASTRVLGHVRVVMSKASYQREIAGIIGRNAALMTVFIVVSLLIVAFSVRRVLRPLERLTENVKAFEKGMPVEPAPVETQDEIGRLASALNDMVAARRAAEESLRESEDRYRRLVELSPDAIYVQQGDKIVFINQAGTRLLGVNGPAEVQDRSIERHVDVGSRDLVDQVMRQAEAGNAVLAPFPVLYRRDDGTEVEAEVSAGPFLFRGKPAALVIARDVTERRDLEEKLHVYEKELYAVAAEMTGLEARIEERERYQIAADLHDFVGQNLVLMQFRLGGLAKSAASSDDLRRIEELREVIQQTIQYTRSLTVELSPPDLAEIGLPAAVEALAEGFSRAYGIRISVTGNTGSRRLDRETRYLLYRNVRELLVNMVKHSKATEATVSLDRTGDLVRISVSDNGRGFDPPEAGDEKGGFGLFTIRQRMERIGGTCDIDARPGGGTTVVLTVRTEQGTGGEDHEERKQGQDVRQ